MPSVEAERDESQTDDFLELLAELGSAALREYIAPEAQWCLLRSFTLKKDGKVYAGRVGGISVPIFNRHGIKAQTSYSFTCFLTEGKRILAVRRVWLADREHESQLQASGHVETFEQGKGFSRVVDSMAADILTDWSTRLQKTITYSVEDLHSHTLRSLEQNMKTYSQMDTPENRITLQKIKEQRVRWLNMYGPDGTSPLLQTFVPADRSSEGAVRDEI
jgi:hypothetical protein